ncbi:MAG TPA: hypothetical protein VFM13_03210 [Gaiellaceae bacterium]|nr:hypothetical protein [Gaiellaceae bacterium]
MRRLVAVLVVGLFFLLLTAGAAGVPDVPGDPTPPVVTPIVTGTLGDAGWYTTNVTVNWSVTDPESIILSTNGCNAVTFIANTTGTQLTCTAESDGGITSVSKTFKVDKTAPAATATPSRGADANGWYNHGLTISLSATDATSGLASCSGPQTYAGPDTAGTAVGGTCRDVAGNTAPASVQVKYDATPPSATPSARAPDANGWFNHAVTVTFQGADGTSGVASCGQQTYSGPDDPSVAVNGTCTDNAGNTSGTAVFTLKYDETPPGATASTSRAPDANGWYSRPLTVSFTGSDGTSGLASCDAATSYSGPDTASASISGACRDLAGNSAPRTVVVKYDATAPQTTATPGRAANGDGWYNAPVTVSFAGTDAVSGLASCTGPQTYLGPDNASASVSGSCTDQAGNVGARAFGLKYDATIPQATASPGRPADANGWYRAPLTVSFTGTDATSGITSCDGAKTYTAPDTTSASLSGACVDRAGNASSTATLGFKYDATAPQVTAAPSRQANANGWYRAPLTVAFSGGDATSGLQSCDGDKTYSGPDAASAAVAGSCRDVAGNAGTASFALKYDGTAPQATTTPSRQPNANGWYNAPLTVGFSATDSTSGLESCPAAQTYSGPDTGAASVSGTCVDRAGNSTAPSFTLKYDQTAPTVSGAAPSRPADLDGWYNHALSVQFQGTDGTSGVESCTRVDYGGPDNGAGSVSGSCADRAGNRSETGSFPLKYDATPPAVTATASRVADANGWYNHPLSVAFAGADATSGVSGCDPAVPFSGPDAASTAVGGACRDRAGNVGSASVVVNYDSTSPTATATPSRPANANGWYSAPLTIAFAGSDGLSGLDSCDAAKSYSGPDRAAALVPGTCKDRAGNLASASLALNYDATPPLAAAVAGRPADANGWYNRPVAVGFAGSDPTSGIQSCTAGQTYAGPDTQSIGFAGSCRDRAGNDSLPSTLTIKYDATAPKVDGATPARSPDRAGWYNRPVAFAVQGSDATSGIDACPTLTYAGPDGTDAAAPAACIDRAGNVATRSFPLRYDATGPHTAATADRGPDANGWYNHPLTIGFAGQDPVSGLESCNPPERYEGPDGATVVVGGACMDNAGNVGLASLEVSYDATAPETTGAAADRPPDAHGWYNHALGVTFHGSDSTSGIDACTATSYAGPDAAAASVPGNCRDRAGNVGTPMTFALRYDASAPSLRNVHVKAGNGIAELSWEASPDTTLVEIRRAAVLVYSGGGTSFTDRRLKNGVRYRYTLAAYDEAANMATATATARPTGPLVAPAAGAVVSRPPRLVWRSVPKATYYNVQLWRNGRILSAWPRRASLQLKRSWTYDGRRYRLTKGTYRWYVWPGLGRPREKRFGRQLGASSFVVR